MLWEAKEEEGNALAGIVARTLSKTLLEAIVGMSLGNIDSKTLFEAGGNELTFSIGSIS